ncbi:MAG: hypothetical protein ACRD3S_07705, partial [Terracidiphilus sp.]
MLSQSWRPIRALTAAALAIAIHPAVSPQTSQHVVSPFELQQAGQQAAGARQQNIETLKAFLNSAEAQKALNKARMDPVEVQKAIAGLNDQDLAQLSARADKAQKEFSAGVLS